MKWIKEHKLASVLIAIAIIFIVVMIVKNNNGSGDLASCIKRSGAKFYGSKTCPHCINQKKMFGSDADKLPYIECLSSEGGKICSEKNIKGYPTWIFADGTRQEGEMTKEALAQKTNCKIK